MKTLDLSNHDYSTFDPACLKAAGVTRVILGCWDFAKSETMLLALRAQGITVEDLYCFLYYRLPWEDNDVLNATELARRHGGITRIWLDCESTFDGPGGQLDTEAAGTTLADRYRITRGYYDALSPGGFEAGIYTGYYWWLEKMGGVKYFGQVGAPLWLANYGPNDPNNPRPPITEVGFGGWTNVAVHQYSSTIPVCGRARDHNYWFLEEEDVELKERVERLEKLLAANGIAKDPAAYVASDYDHSLLTVGEEALAYAASKGWSAFLGLGLAQTDIASHKVSPHGGASGGGDVPAHTHVPGEVSTT